MISRSAIAWCSNPPSPAAIANTAFDGQHNHCAHGVFLGGPQAPGMFRDYITLPAGNCTLVPTTLDYRTASLIEPIAVMMHMLELIDDPRRRCRGGHRRRSDRNVVRCDRESIGRGQHHHRGSARLSLEAGTCRWAPMSRSTPPRSRCLKPSLDATHGRGADVVLEASGSSEMVNAAIRCARMSGIVMLIGLLNELNPQNRYSDRDGERAAPANAEAVESSRAGRARMLQSGKIPTSLITHTLPLAETPQAFEMLDTYSDGIGKAVIECRRAGGLNRSIFNPALRVNRKSRDRRKPAPFGFHFLSPSMALVVQSSVCDASLLSLAILLAINLSARQPVHARHRDGGGAGAARGRRRRRGPQERRQRHRRGGRRRLRAGGHPSVRRATWAAADSCWFAWPTAAPRSSISANALPESASHDMYLDAQRQAHARQHRGLALRRAFRAPFAASSSRSRNTGGRNGQTCWQPAIELASKGFPVSYAFAESLKSSRNLAQDPESKRIFQRDGTYLRRGRYLRPARSGAHARTHRQDRREGFLRRRDRAEARRRRWPRTAA